MIKKLAALALALALPALASASDLNPGALQLSGTTSFDWGKNTYDSDATGKIEETRIGAELSAMYFVSHFLGFGLEVGYDHLKYDGGDYDSTFLFGPKAGIDWELMEHLSVFGDLTVGIARGETQIADVIDTGDGFGYQVAGGLRLFLNRNVSLDLFGAFDQVRLDFPAAGKVTVSDLSMGVGLSVYLTNNPSNAVYP
jgi:opacity protein-like surface antigen